MKVYAWERTALLVRSFAVQGSWNYRTLIGAGFAFALLPVLRRLYAGDPAALRASVNRHAALFNCHPYLVPVALGAVARLEEEGTDPALIERFKAAIRGSLGGLGDRLIWAGWRPVCLLGALAMALLGAPWWLTLVAFLGVYNLGHLLVRAWGLEVGYAEGKRVGERLRRARVTQVQRTLEGSGAFLIGLLIPLAASAAFLGERMGAPWIVLGSALALLAGRWGSVLRTPALVLLGIFVVIGMFVGVLQ